MLEIDIKSANPTFIDIMLGTDIGPHVYNNLQEKFNISRDDAKIMFNTKLNDHRQSRQAAIKFFLDAGYPEDKAELLATETTKTSGAFYKRMTQYEADAINKFFFENEIGQSIRIHDALVCYILPRATPLKTEIDGVRFKIKEL